MSIPGVDSKKLSLALVMLRAATSALNEAIEIGHDSGDDSKKIARILMGSSVSDIKILQYLFKSRRFYPFDGSDDETDWAHAAALTIIDSFVGLKGVVMADMRAIHKETRIKMVNQMKKIILLASVDCEWYKEEKGTD